MAEGDKFMKTTTSNEEEPLFKRLLVIGGGKMAEALVRGFVFGSRLFRKETNIFVCVRSPESVERWKKDGFPFAYRSDVFYAEVSPQAGDLILLCVKPQEFEVFQRDANKFCPWVYSSSQLTLISVMAGIGLETLAAGMKNIGKGQLKRAHFAEGRIARLQPNLNAASGNGTLLLCAPEGFPESELEAIKALALTVGSCIEIKEREMDAAAAIAGCGPAFIYTMIEALADGGVLCGLSRHLAMQLAAEMVKGSAAHVLSTEQHPGALKDAVCSPAGTTIAGIRVLEQKGMRSAFMEAVVASTERSRELGKAMAGASPSSSTTSGGPSKTNAGAGSGKKCGNKTK